MLKHGRVNGMEVAGARVFMGVLQPVTNWHKVITGFSGRIKSCVYLLPVGRDLFDFVVYSGTCRKWFHVLVYETNQSKMCIIFQSIQLSLYHRILYRSLLFIFLVIFKRFFVVIFSRQL